MATTPEDDALVQRVRAGEIAAYEYLFLTYYASLVRFSSAYVASRDAAEELVADVFEGIWEQRATWSPGRIAAYLYRATRNRSLNVLRDGQRRAAHHQTMTVADIRATSGVVPEPGEGIEVDERVRLVRAALARLSERQRTLLVLRWEHELAWDAIASVLGLTVSAAQTDHTRALRALRAYLPADLR
jgi:RNA polymerase sigma-70 factor (ECF subfamily)